MAKQLAHPHFARRYFIAALGWDQPLLEAFRQNMRRWVYTKWIASALRSDNLALLQKVNPREEPVLEERWCWTIGGSPSTPLRRRILYGVQHHLSEGKIWISRWVGQKRSKLQQGMGLDQAIAMDLEALETISQVGHWFGARGVAAEATAKNTAIYRLGRLKVATKLAAGNHRVRLTLKTSPGGPFQANADFRMYWYEGGFTWEQQVVTDDETTELFDEETMEKRTDRATIFRTMELLSEAQNRSTKEV
jgi:hypothetical protein